MGKEGVRITLPVSFPTRIHFLCGCGRTYSLSHVGQVIDVTLERDRSERRKRMPKKGTKKRKPKPY
jgi:hypothetical protein